ncbi:hypothetical protein DRN69_00450 [Candidatus Pacearchaeota archaeon]|nr:MAG: hypothetical protein DRN69_00450 [Candidatus Pacearchaeota archaeon]RLJ02315.1 MAG: hypothetical protein DRP10_01685 [Candidatus Aenigmarchaeota archaeon]
MRIIENKENRVVFETEETQTLLNLLVDRLWNEKGIKKVAYGSKHPFLEKMQLLVEGKNIKKSIEKACDSIIKDCNELLKKI